MRLSVGVCVFDHSFVTLRPGEKKFRDVDEL